MDTDRNDRREPLPDVEGRQDPDLDARADTSRDDRAESTANDQAAADPDMTDGERTDSGSRLRGDLDIEGRWEVTQSRFLESPHEAVAAADELIADVIDDFRRRLDDERAEVAERWRDDGADTEDLRTAMLRYRELLDRLTPGA
jgi:hypothetical protein